MNVRSREMRQRALNMSHPTGKLANCGPPCHDFCFAVAAYSSERVIIFILTIRLNADTATINLKKVAIFPRATNCTVNSNEMKAAQLNFDCASPLQLFARPSEQRAVHKKKKNRCITRKKLKHH